MDMEELGQVLLERREALGISRAEIARRIGVSPSYVWLVEEAKPRKSGNPSQPSKEVLESWAKVLGWDAPYTRQLLVLSGHIPSAPSATTRPHRLPFTAGTLHFPQPKKMEEEVLIQKLRELLRRSSASEEKREEVVELLQSFFEWLDYRLGG